MIMNPEMITLRPLRKEDYPQIEDIIRKTWKYDSLSKSPKDARHMARLYLRSCLRRATFSCVAVENDKVLGIILANSKHAASKPGILSALSQFYAILLLFTTRSGRKLGRFFQRIDTTDIELLQDCSRDFDGEICFFAVDENTRGTGLGKKLFAAALDYLKKEKVHSFYLFTDSSCTYQFYEKRGMQRLAEKVLAFQPLTDYQLHMFVYGYELQV